MMDKTLDYVKMNVYIHSKERELNVYTMRDNTVDNTFNMEDYITYERFSILFLLILEVKRNLLNDLIELIHYLLHG